MHIVDVLDGCGKAWSPLVGPFLSVLAQTGIETALHLCRGSASGTVDSFLSGGAFASQKALTIEEMWSRL